MIFPRVYPILDTESLARRSSSLSIAADAFLDAGAGILQIRHKAHWSRDVFAEAELVARLAREAGAILIVNDRADIAMLLDAGLHIGQDDLPPRDARRLIGPDAILGFSTHNAAQLSAAGGAPVSYVAFGPIFPTASKENPDPVTGTAELTRIRALVEQPLVAIGGITLENARDVLAAGADSVAVISALLPVPYTNIGLRKRMEEWLDLMSDETKPAVAPARLDAGKPTAEG
ncbi:MAG: thiamine phosphate synthase [Bryobacterales bacterium]|nr:thiamine phosphate synthase [Bryobacterales bacterium]